MADGRAPPSSADRNIIEESISAAMDRLAPSEPRQQNEPHQRTPVESDNESNAGAAPPSAEDSDDGRQVRHQYQNADVRTGRARIEFALYTRITPLTREEADDLEAGSADAAVGPAEHQPEDENAPEEDPANAEPEDVLPQEAEDADQALQQMLLITARQVAAQRGMSLDEFTTSLGFAHNLTAPAPGTLERRMYDIQEKIDAKDAEEEEINLVTESHTAPLQSRLDLLATQIRGLDNEISLIQGGVDAASAQITTSRAAGAPAHLIQQHERDLATAQSLLAERRREKDLLIVSRRRQQMTLDVFEAGSRRRLRAVRRELDELNDQLLELQEQQGQEEGSDFDELDQEDSDQEGDEWESDQSDSEQENSEPTEGSDAEMQK